MSDPKSPPGDVPETEDFATLFAESEARRGGNPYKRRDPKEGDVVKGRVVSITRESVFVDLGAKSDGMLEIADVKDGDGKVTVAVGDEIEARVSEIDGKAGVIVLRKSLGRGRGAEGAKELSDAFNLQIPIEGLVSAVNKGGLEVQIAGMRCFCPMSQVEVRPISAEDAAALVGKRLQFKVTRYEEGPRPNVVLSRRALLEAENAERAAVTREKLVPGAVLRGRVVALKDFGAFVDLGGLEGLVHNSELGYERVAHASDVLTVGQEIEVAVVRIEPDPKTGGGGSLGSAERGGTGKSPPPKDRISLSLRALMTDPWKEATSRLQEGTELEGKVLRLESFGAFVELAPSVEGLLHLSELEKGKKRIRHPKEAVSIGQTLRVIILGLDLDRHRISLGLADEARDVGDNGGGSQPGAQQRLGTFADLLKKK